jgi:hypothetical protein
MPEETYAVLPVTYKKPLHLESPRKVSDFSGTYQSGTAFLIVFMGINGKSETYI